MKVASLMILLAYASPHWDEQEKGHFLTWPGRKTPEGWPQWGPAKDDSHALIP